MAEPKFREFTEDELYSVPAETEAKLSPPKMTVVPETKSLPYANLPSIPLLNTPEKVVASNETKSFYQENKLVILLIGAVIIGWVGYTVYKANEDRKKKKNGYGQL